MISSIAILTSVHGRDTKLAVTRTLQLVVEGFFECCVVVEWFKSVDRDASREQQKLIPRRQASANVSDGADIAHEAAEVLTTSSPCAGHVLLFDVFEGTISIMMSEKKLVRFHMFDIPLASSMK